jgi:hypothetical protein
LLEAVNVGSEIQLAGQKLVSAGVAGQKGHFAAVERSQNVGIGRVSEGSLLLKFVGVAKTGHVVQATAADYAYLCLLQLRSWSWGFMTVSPQRLKPVQKLGQISQR